VAIFLHTAKNTWKNTLTNGTQGNELGSRMKSRLQGMSANRGMEELKTGHSESII
jgi:hypothetical protein